MTSLTYSNNLENTGEYLNSHRFDLPARKKRQFCFLLCLSDTTRVLIGQLSWPFSTVGPFKNLKFNFTTKMAGDFSAKF